MAVRGKRGTAPKDWKSKAAGDEADEKKITIEALGHETTTTSAGLAEMAALARERNERAGGVENGQVRAFFKEAKLLRDKEGHQLVRADFVVVVSQSNVKLLPKGIRAEWDGMKAERLLTEVSLDGQKLPVQVVQARMRPDKPLMKFFEAVGRLERVKLTEVTDKNTSWIELRVSITRGKDQHLWAWLSDNYPGQSVWLKFEEAQGELMENFLDNEGGDSRSA